MLENQNQSLYEVSSVELQGALVTWCFSLALLSILGNSLVLVSSVKYNAIKLDPISVQLIRHIAIADLAYAFCVILQVGIALALNQWPFGHALCEVSTYLQYFLAIADINMMGLLNVAKLMCILRPLVALSRSKRTGCWLVAGSWLMSHIHPGLCAILRRPIDFDYRSYRLLNPHLLQYYGCKIS